LKIKGEDVRLDRGFVFVPAFKGKGRRKATFRFSRVGDQLFQWLTDHRPQSKFLVGVGCKHTTSWRRLLALAGLDGKYDRRMLRATSRTAYSNSGTLPEATLRKLFGHGTDVADDHYIDEGRWGKGEMLDDWLCATETLPMLVESIRINYAGNRKIYEEVKRRQAAQASLSGHPVLSKQVEAV
jgi:hypothetical protein